MDDDEIYTLKHFDVEGVNTDQIYVILGDNDVLAEMITRDICQQLCTSVRFVNVFSAPSKYKSIFSDYVPSSCVFHDFHKSAIVKLFKQQHNNLETLKKLSQSSSPQQMEEAKQSFNTLIILDRINAKWLKDIDINEYFGLARDMHITIIWRSVDSIVPKTIANKFDYCFILTAASVTEQNSIYRAFAGVVIPNQKIFKTLLTSTLTKNCSLVVDRRRHIQKDEDPDMMWLQGLAKYSPKLYNGMFRLGISKLWSYTNEENWVETPNSNLMNIPQDNKLDLQTILQTYGGKQKLRIQIIDEDEDDSGHIINEPCFAEDLSPLMHRFLSDS